MSDEINNTPKKKCFSLSKFQCLGVLAAGLLLIGGSYAMGKCCLQKGNCYSTVCE